MAKKSPFVSMILVGSFTRGQKLIGPFPLPEDARAYAKRNFGDRMSYQVVDAFNPKTIPEKQMKVLI